MSTIPPVQVKIEADTTGLKTGLDQAKAGIKGVDDSVKTASTGMKSFVDNLKQVGSALGVAFAGAQVAKFAKDSIMASSNMAESLSKVQIVFGETADEVIAFSQTAANSMGMSSQAALEAAGTYGNLFQALGVNKQASQDMSVGLVQLAADLASFNNMSVTDSLNALRSGLSGETEPLKRFGIALNDVTLKNKAMAMGFGEIKGVMDPAIKAQVTYALVMEQTGLAQGDYSRTASGAANTMKTLQAKFEDAKVAIGDALMPAFRALLTILKLIIPILSALGAFFVKNEDYITALGIGIGVATAAFVAYKTVLIVTTTASKLYAIAQVIMRGGQLASIASTNGLAASMLVLNAAMRANPIGIIVTAIALLVAGFVMAYKKSETFRNIIGTIAKAVVSYIAMMIRAWGDIITTIMKVVTGPLKLFLTVLSKLPGVGGAAKQGLKMIDGAIEGVGDFAESTAKKVEGFKDKIDAFTKSANESAKAGKNAKKKGKEKGGTGDDEDTTVSAGKKSKLEEYKKDVLSIYKDMNETIAEANEKAGEALLARDEKIADARERALEQEADLRKRYSERMADAQKRYDETIADAKERFREADAEITKRYYETEFAANKEYAAKTLDLTTRLNEKLIDLREKAAKKSVDLTKAAADKQDGIIKQSIDRLRTAFATKTGFSLSDSIKDGVSVDKMLADLKQKLQEAKDLQANAAALAGMGYSQVFIEEVVKQGPEAGNKIAEALKAASPEATKELQSLYGQVDTISEHGLDDLAKTMNSGANLATQELKNAYAQVAIDLKESLAVTDSELQKSLADANAEYAKAMVDAKVIRDEKIAEAEKQLVEAFAKADAELAKSIAQANKTLTEAQADAKKDLDEGLADIQKTLQKALLDAQKDYDKAIDDINKSTQKKMDELKAKLIEVATLMKDLDKAAAKAALVNAPTTAKAGAIIPAEGYDPNRAGMTANPYANAGLTVNNNITATSVNPNDVHLATLSAIKYGAAVTGRMVTT